MPVARIISTHTETDSIFNWSDSECFVMRIYGRD
jgi:hypothetical protein